MQRIALADKFFNLVKEGKKVSTVRYKKRDYKLGKFEFYSDTSDMTIQGAIIDVTYMKVFDLDDVHAVLDGFEDRDELINALLEFYPDMHGDDDVTIVSFDCTNCK